MHHLKSHKMLALGLLLLSAKIASATNLALSVLFPSCTSLTTAVNDIAIGEVCTEVINDYVEVTVKVFPGNATDGSPANCCLKESHICNYPMERTYDINTTEGICQLEDKYEFAMSAMFNFICDEEGSTFQLDGHATVLCDSALEGDDEEIPGDPLPDGEGGGNYPDGEFCYGAMYYTNFVCNDPCACNSFLGLSPQGVFYLIDPINQSSEPIFALFGGGIFNSNLPGFTDIAYDCKECKIVFEVAQEFGYFLDPNLVGPAAGLGEYIGFPYPFFDENGTDYNYIPGMDYVDGVLYGTHFDNVFADGVYDPTSGLLVTINTNLSTAPPTIFPVGPTDPFGNATFNTSVPIVGLTYDHVNEIMYGVTQYIGVEGIAPASWLVTVDLETGLISTLFPYPIMDPDGDYVLGIESMEFGPDGYLWASIAFNFLYDDTIKYAPGWMFTIDVATSVATPQFLVNATELGAPFPLGISGLTCVPARPFYA